MLLQLQKILYHTSLNQERTTMIVMTSGPTAVKRAMKKNRMLRKQKETKLMQKNGVNAEIVSKRRLKWNVYAAEN